MSTPRDTKSSVSRKLVLSMITVLIVVVLIELQSWVFAELAMRLSALRFYPPDLLVRMSDEDLGREASRGPLGWPADDAPRAAGAEPHSVCGTAFGDSMTYSSEVDRDQAWVHVLSLRLGCTVRNYAVSAYGMDQALLRYERIETEGAFVILGLYLEMIRRSVAASWTFYAPTVPMSVYQIKPLFSLDGEGLRLHSRPEPMTRDTVADHHSIDYYMRHVATAVTFPYTLAAARAGYIRLARTDDYRRNTEKYFDPAHPSGSGVLTRRLIDRLAEKVRQRNARLAVVLIPIPSRLAADTVWEEQFAADLRRRTEICVIDLKPRLREHARPLGGVLPTAPQGHYTAGENRVIADIVASGLRACNIAP